MHARSAVGVGGAAARGAGRGRDRSSRSPTEHALDPAAASADAGCPDRACHRARLRRTARAGWLPSRATPSTVILLRDTDGTGLEIYLMRRVRDDGVRRRHARLPRGRWTPRDDDPDCRGGRRTGRPDRGRRPRLRRPRPGPRAGRVRGRGRPSRSAGCCWPVGGRRPRARRPGWRREGERDRPTSWPGDVDRRRAAPARPGRGPGAAAPVEPLGHTGGGGPPLRHALLRSRRCPRGRSAHDVGGEADRVRWGGPALRAGRGDAGRCPCCPPTSATLAELAAHATRSSALAAAARAGLPAAAAGPARRRRRGALAPRGRAHRRDRRRRRTACTPAEDGVGGSTRERAPLPCWGPSRRGRGGRVTDRATLRAGPQPRADDPRRHQHLDAGASRVAATWVVLDPGPDDPAHLDAVEAPPSSGRPGGARAAHPRAPRPRRGCAQPGRARRCAGARAGPGPPARGPRASATVTWSTVGGLEVEVVATPGHTAD